VKNIPKNVELILDRLRVSGYSAYIVGGCVRDLFLKLQPKDFDVATCASPKQVKEVFAGVEGIKVIPTGEKYGTITLRVRAEVECSGSKSGTRADSGVDCKSDIGESERAEYQNIEVTTYRLDGEYLDGRRPNSVKFSENINDDLARRDFTINALAYGDTLIDLFGGLDDIKNGVVKAVGNAKERFREDALRILRALRFASRFGFTIEKNTYSAMLALKHTLAKVAPERIQTELREILPNLKAQNLEQAKPFLLEIFPVLKLCDIEQNNKYHNLSILDHNLKACIEVVPYFKPFENTSESDAKNFGFILRLAALLHDTGKVYTRTTNLTTGQDQYINHEKKSADMARQILKDLKFDNATISLVCTLLYHHGRMHYLSKKSVKRFLSKVGEEIFLLLLQLQIADNKAKVLKLSQNKLERIEKVKQILKQIKADNEAFSLKDLAINGFDILDANIAKGAAIGKILDACLSYVIDNPSENNKVRLIKYAKKLRRGVDAK